MNSRFPYHSFLQILSFHVQLHFSAFLLHFATKFRSRVMASLPPPLNFPTTLVLIYLLTFSAAQQPPTYCRDNGFNYTSNSVYDANLNSLLSTLSQNVEDNGFYNASVGQNPDRANAVALCRGDVQLDRCRSCVQDSTSELVRLCPNSKQGVIYYEFCMLRFSNVSIFRTFASSPFAYAYNIQNATSRVQFVRDRGSLIGNLRDVAAGGDSRRKVGFGAGSTADNQTIYALVQCSPDLFSDDCGSCLNELLRIQGGLEGGSSSVGARVMSPSCNYRYETRTFYNETRLREFLETAPESMPPPPSPPPPGGSGEDGNSSSRTTIIVVSSVVALVVILALCAGVFFITRMRKRRQDYETVDDEIASADSMQFDFDEIKAATDDFADSNKLGEGGFGSVYKGKLSSGQEIAVKRLSASSLQGDAEFKNEVLLISKLQHRNLVRLLGFSLARNEKLLVYEFVKNTSLDQFIFDPIKRSDLGWESRFKIIVGIARGLLYLHEESQLRMIHRDLKAANILLDDGMNAKIADFGMARLIVAGETQGNTSRIVGTYGYMSPEYAMHGQFSDKSDVFSFGVLILEIISGQKNNSFTRGDRVNDLLSSAWKYRREGKIEEIIDPALRGSSNQQDVLRCIHIGLLCVQENPSSRPKMASVVLMLSSFTISLPMLSEPVVFAQVDYDSVELDSSIWDPNGKLAHSTESSKNDISVTELYPR